MAMTQEELVVRLGLDQTALSSGLRGAETQVSKFQQQVKQSMTGLLKSNIMGLWMEVFGQFRDQWDKLTKWMADEFFGIKMQQARARELDRNKSFLRSLREQFDKEDAERAESDKARKKYEKENALMNEQIVLMRELNDLAEKGWKDEDTKVIQTKLKLLAISQKRIEQEITMAARAGDQEQVNKQQVLFEQGRSRQIDLQNQIKDKARASQDASREFQREQAAKDAKLRPMIQASITKQMQEEERVRQVFNAQRRLEGLPLIPSKIPTVSDILGRPEKNLGVDEIKELNSTFNRLWKEGLTIKAAE